MVASVSERVIRVRQGDPVPDGYFFKKWLGVESGLLYGPGYADVLLVTTDGDDNGTTRNSVALPDSGPALVQDRTTE